MAFAADASAVMVKAGAAAARGFGKGTRAFVYGDGGMLLEAAIGGQKFKFKPASRGGDEEEESGNKKESGGNENEQGGVMGSIGSAASRSIEFVKKHPVITTVAGVSSAAGITLLVLWKLHSGASSTGQSDDDAQQEDSDEQMSADQGEDQQEDEADQEDAPDQESQRGGNGRSRFASAERGSR
jgi:hypothetical protein